MVFLSTTRQTHQKQMHLLDLECLRVLQYRGNDEIGRLMHDFSCTNPDDMNYEALAKKARYFKHDEKGVATMCKIMEDMRSGTENSKEGCNDRRKEKHYSAATSGIRY